MTIFEKLKNTPYAIGVGKIQAKGVSDEFAQDYFMLVRKQDCKNMYWMCFSDTKEYKDVYQRDMSKKEIQFFREHLEEYELVVDNPHGKVYEYKLLPLKKYLPKF